MRDFLFWQQQKPNKHPYSVDPLTESRGGAGARWVCCRPTPYGTRARHNRERAGVDDDGLLLVLVLGCLTLHGAGVGLSCARSGLARGLIFTGKKLRSRPTDQDGRE